MKRDWLDVRCRGHRPPKQRITRDILRVQRRGRPVHDEFDHPWVKAGMSKSAFYRAQKAKSDG